MSPQRIQRRRVKGWRKPDNTVIVDRTSRWGNPFRVGSLVIEPGWHNAPCALPYDGTHSAGTRIGDKLIRPVRDRADAVALFRAYVRWNDDVWTPEFIAPLVGRDLACPCPPGEQCHADVLLGMAAGGAL